MEIGKRGEEFLIEFLQSSLRDFQKRILVGIGDDTCVFKKNKVLLLLTTDSLVEGVHFHWEYTPPRDLGWKLVSVNVSDIAAMGGNPLVGLLSLSLPPHTPFSRFKEFIEGVKEALSFYRFEIGGGNLASSSKFSTSFFLLGEVKKEKPVLRRGAREGDLLWLTGFPGEAEAGRISLERNFKGLEESKKRWLRPLARLKEGKILARKNLCTSMIDLSDGLVLDLFHLLKESKMGAVIEEKKIPLSLGVKEVAWKLSKDPLEFALYGGEDYELLFTSPPSLKRELVTLGAKEIGRIRKGEGIFLKKGKKEKLLRPKGYNHFRGR